MEEKTEAQEDLCPSECRARALLSAGLESLDAPFPYVPPSTSTAPFFTLEHAMR